MGAAKEIILAMVVIVIGVGLVGTIVSSTESAADNDTANAGIYNLIPLMFALLILVGGAIAALLKVLNVI